MCIRDSFFTFNRFHHLFIPPFAVNILTSYFSTSTHFLCTINNCFLYLPPDLFSINLFKFNRFTSERSYILILILLLTKLLTLNFTYFLSYHLPLHPSPH